MDSLCTNFIHLGRRLFKKRSGKVRAAKLELSFSVYGRYIPSCGQIRKTMQRKMEQSFESESNEETMEPKRGKLAV
jgi:hypothetical protein